MAIRWLEDVADGKERTIGKKAASLAVLSKYGLNTPRGFVVTAPTFEQFVQDNGLENRIESILNNVDRSDINSLQRAANRIHNLILGEDLSDSVKSEIEDAYENINLSEEVRNAGGEAVNLVGGQRETEFVAVRSSPTGARIPGVHRSEMNVNGKDSLIEAVKKCWASLYAVEALSVDHAADEDTGQIHSMAVLVQRMVEADVSGTAFTRHPVTMDDNYLIESLWGLGTAIHDGSGTPDQYVIDRDGNTVRNTIAVKEWKVTRDPTSGKTITQRVASDEQQAQSLESSEIDRVLDTVKKVEGRVGDNLRIDFTISRNRLHVIDMAPFRYQVPAERNTGEQNRHNGQSHRDSLNHAAQDTARTASNTQPQQTSGMNHLQNTAGTGMNTNPDSRHSTAVNTEQQGDGAETSPVLRGRGTAAGTMKGEVSILYSDTDVSDVNAENLIVSVNASERLIPALNRVNGVITDNGGIAANLAAVARTLQVPCVLGTSKATDTLTQGEAVTIDGNEGTVTDGVPQQAADETVPVKTSSAATGRSMQDATDGSASTPAAVLDGALTATRLKVLGRDNTYRQEAEGLVIPEFASYADATEAVELYGSGQVWVRTRDADVMDMEHVGVITSQVTENMQGRGAILSTYGDVMRSNNLVERGAGFIGLDVAALQDDGDAESLQNAIRKLGEETATHCESALLLRAVSPELIEHAVESGIDTIAAPAEQLAGAKQAVAKAEKRFILRKLREL